jgi:hypothetical protein
VGGNNFAPQTAGARLLFLLNSVIGTSVISLTITYLMQIYGALRSRNSLCLKIHALSGETGDAAELLAHLFAKRRLQQLVRARGRVHGRQGSSPLLPHSVRFPLP